MAVTSEQCREARQRLNWTRQELADAAGVPVIVITDFEDQGVVTIAALLDDVRAALETVGIGFPFELSRGEAKPAGITYSPRDKTETH